MSRVTRRIVASSPLRRFNSRSFDIENTIALPATSHSAAIACRPRGNPEAPAISPAEFARSSAKIATVATISKRTPTTEERRIPAATTSRVNRKTSGLPAPPVTAHIPPITATSPNIETHITGASAARIRWPRTCVARPNAAWAISNETIRPRGTATSGEAARATRTSSGVQ